MFIIAVVSLTLQFGMTAALWKLGAAPRWRRVRWFAVVAFSAGCFSTVDAIAWLVNARLADPQWSLRTNLFFGVVHGAAWLVYTRIDERGRWSSLPVWVRRWAIGLVATAAFLSLTTIGLMKDGIAWLDVPAFGVHHARRELGAAGLLLAGTVYVTLVVSALTYVRQWRAGVPGAGLVVAGFVVFIVTALEEILVAGGHLQFLFLADLGYLCVVTPVTAQLLGQFREDANRLDEITDHLADEVQRRTDERDRARAQMLEQQRLAALGRLAAGVGHEVNNPLQYLHFTLEEMREMARQSHLPEAESLVDRAFEGVDRIRLVVEDLRTYARPGATQFAPLDLREVVQAALRVGASQWRSGTTVAVALDGVPPVLGHEGRLVQLVLNPLVNGTQAMRTAGDPARTTLTVCTRTTAEGWAELEIRDQGPGFDPEVVSRLGEPYITTKAEQGGTGLGLFVSRGIVEAHGGRMSFGNAPGGGAVVTIQLPPATASAETQAMLATAISVSGEHTLGASGTSLRVLMLEDEEPALRALLRGLRLEGIEATGFTQGEAALLWLAHAGPDAVDLVVTDLMMPGMSGWEFAARLAASHPQLRQRLVVLTGGASTPEAQAFVTDPSLLVLDKPITRTELAEALRQRVFAA